MKDEHFLSESHVTVAGGAEPGASPVPVQRPTPDCQGPVRWPLQAQRESAGVWTVAHQSGYARRRRGQQVTGDILRDGLANYQRGCYVQVSDGLNGAL